MMRAAACCCGGTLPWKPRVGMANHVHSSNISLPSDSKEVYDNASVYMLGKT
jgi:hypothetical protein